MLLKGIHLEGTLGFDIVYNRAHYEKLKTQYELFGGVVLPNVDDIDFDINWFILQEPIKIKFKTYEYELERGFITDFLSIPRLFKGMIEQHKALLSAMVHDANFGFKLLSFEESNQLFYEMLLAEGVPHFLALTFSEAVKTKKGRSVYKTDYPKDKTVRAKVTRSNI